MKYFDYSQPDEMKLTMKLEVWITFLTIKTYARKTRHWLK